MLIHSFNFLAFDGGVSEYIIGSLIISALAAGVTIAIGALTNRKPDQALKDFPPNDITRGGYLPLVIGRRVVGCHVGWVGDRVSYQQGSSGKGIGGGGSGNAATYYLEGAMHQLCHGPAAVLHRIWCGDRIVWNKPFDFGEVADGSQFIFANKGGVFRVYGGRTDQPQDDYLQARTGVGSAFPGLVYVVYQRKNLGTGTTWPPFKYEIETRPDDIAAACGLNLTWCTVPVWRDESVPSQTGTNGVTVFLNTGTSIPAGSYKITYREGAYKLNVERGWQVHSEFANTHIAVVDSVGTSIVECPGTNTIYAAQEDAEVAESGASATFTWAGGVMGIRFRDTSVYTKCVPGTPNPTYDVELVAGGPVYTAAIVVQAGSAASGDSGVNPAVALFIILCAPFPYGCGMSPASIDLVALAAAAVALDTEGLVVNVLAENGRDAADVVASLLSDIGMMLPQVGAVLKPYLVRTETTVPTLTDDMIQGGPPEENRQQGTYNADRFTFQIADVLNDFATSDVSADDDAQAASNNRPQATTITLENITSRTIARQVANRKQLELGAQLQVVPAFTVLREARNPKFHPGRAFSMDGVQYRVSGWQPDTKGVSVQISATVDQFGDTSNMTSTGGEGDTYGDEPSAPPEPDLFFLPLIIPRVQWPSKTNPCFGVGRVRANHSVIAATVWISTTDTGTYQQVGEQNPWSAGGTLVDAFDATPGVLTTGPDITPFNDDIQFTPDLSGDTASYNAGVLLVACEQELMLLESVTANLDGSYTLNNVTRGAFNTAVAAHAIDTPLVLIERLQLSPLFTPLLAAHQGETLWVKTQPSDGVEVVDLSLVTPEPLYVPVNLLATISITAPVGSPTVPIGVTYLITWKTTELTGNLKVEFSDDGGATWSTLAASIADTGSFAWDTTGLTATAEAVIRVSSVLTPDVQDTTYPFTLAVIDAPDAPTLSGNAGEKQATLSWTAVADVIAYNVKRADVTGGPYTTVATIWSKPGGVIPTTYVDGGLTNGTEYFYVVTAVVDGAESADSNEVSLTPFHCDCGSGGGGGDDTIPAALVAIAGDGQVYLVWSTVDTATTYTLKRSTTMGGPYSDVVSQSGTSYTDTTVTNGTTYYYVVTATIAGVEGGPSNEASATPTATPTGDYDSDVLSDSPAAFWKLDDTSGSSTAADSSGGGHALTAHSGLSFGSTAPPMGGTSVDIPGSGYLDTTAFNPAISVGYTVEWWWKLTGDLIFSNRIGAGDGYFISEARGTGGVAIGVDYPTSGSDFLDSPDTDNLVDDTNWHHVVFTLDASNNAVLYKDGQVYATGTFAAGSGSPWPGFTISAPSNVLTGNVARVAVYLVPLSAGRILHHWAVATNP